MKKVVKTFPLLSGIIVAGTALAFLSLISASIIVATSAFVDCVYGK